MIYLDDGQCRHYHGHPEHRRQPTRPRSDSPDSLYSLSLLFLVLWMIISSPALALSLSDALLTQPIKRDATTLPSVNELKGKIMIKHKKLPDRNSEVFTIRVEEGK